MYICMYIVIIVSSANCWSHQRNFVISKVWFTLTTQLSFLFVLWQAAVLPLPHLALFGVISYCLLATVWRQLDLSPYLIKCSKCYRARPGLTKYTHRHTLYYATPAHPVTPSKPMNTNLLYLIQSMFCFCFHFSTVAIDNNNGDILFCRQI